jgi:hypothetical protein
MRFSTAFFQVLHQSESRLIKLGKGSLVFGWPAADKAGFRNFILPPPRLFKTLSLEIEDEKSPE